MQTNPARVIRSLGVAPLISAFYTLLICALMYFFTHTGTSRWGDPC